MIARLFERYLRSERELRRQRDAELVELVKALGEALEELREELEEEER